MDPLYFTSEGREFFCIREGGPNLDWVETVLRTVNGASVERNEGIYSESVSVHRGADSVLIHDDPMAAGILISWPVEEPKSTLLKEILQVLTDRLLHRR
jgi:hypothetical protein